MKIKLLAASDRNNYGDLLFPLIIKHYAEAQFGDKVQVENYAVIRSDLSWFGALKTQSHRDLIHDIEQNTNPANCKIIIAGGEVLGGDWLNIYRFLSPAVSRFNKLPLLPRLVKRFDLLAYWFKQIFKSSYPFILDHSYFNKRAGIYYNSIGAANVKSLLPRRKKMLASYFSKVAHISVRDIDSVKALELLSAKALLVPDSALIMSDVFKEEHLRILISERIRSLDLGPYVYVQLGEVKGPDDLNKFGNDLREFSRRKSVRIVLSPIGLALDHGDDKILKYFGDMFPDFLYVEPHNLYDIMFLIKNSKGYLGTSLHGVITAQSFNVPFVAFTEKIEKLERYIETWFENAETLYTTFAEFERTYHAFEIFDAAQAEDRTNRQKRMIYENLNTILN